MSEIETINLDKKVLNNYDYYFPQDCISDNFEVRAKPYQQNSEERILILGIRCRGQFINGITECQVFQCPFYGMSKFI